MIQEPRCYTRRCRHFAGVKQSDETEETEKLVCRAFTDGIPEDIAFGTNKHTEPFPGDKGIRYERADDVIDINQGPSGPEPTG